MTTAAGEISSALKALGKMAILTSKTLQERLHPPDDMLLLLKRMAVCCDFRKMAFDAVNYTTPEAKVKLPLSRLYDHLALRFTDFDGNPISVELNDMPPFEVVYEQFKVLTQLLSDAAKVHPYASGRKNASGVVVRYWPSNPIFLHSLGLTGVQTPVVTDHVRRFHTAALLQRL